MPSDETSDFGPGPLSTDPTLPSDREARLDEVIAAYLRDLQAGVTLDDSGWLARHPDLADDLAAFLADR